MVGADGPYSKTREQFAISQPTEFLRGIGAEVTGIELDPDFVEIFVGNSIAPGFFAWMIPTNENGTEARIGLCIDQETKQSPNYYFSNLFKNKCSSPYLEHTKIIRKIGGAIPLGILKKTYSSNLLLVGDAAAQVKPTSGGGIYTGLVCGNHCSSVVIDALETNNFTSRFLKKYQKMWMEDIGMELYFGMKFRKLFKNLNDDFSDIKIKCISFTKNKAWLFDYDILGNEILKFVKDLNSIRNEPLMSIRLKSIDKQTPLYEVILKLLKD